MNKMRSRGLREKTTTSRRRKTAVETAARATAARRQTTAPQKVVQDDSTGALWRTGELLNELGFQLRQAALLRNPTARARSEELGKELATTARQLPEAVSARDALMVEIAEEVDRQLREIARETWAEYLVEVYQEAQTSFEAGDDSLASIRSALFRTLCAPVEKTLLQVLERIDRELTEDSRRRLRLAMHVDRALRPIEIFDELMETAPAGSSRWCADVAPSRTLAQSELPPGAGWCDELRVRWSEAGLSADFPPPDMEAEIVHRERLLALCAALRDEACESPAAAGAPPAEFESSPMSFRRAARLMGWGESRDAAELLKKAVEEGQFRCRSLSRQRHVFDVRQAPQLARRAPGR